MANVRRTFKQVINKKQSTLPIYPGVLGNNSGVVDAGSGLVYVRISNIVQTAVSNGIGMVYGLSVWVGYSADQPRVFKILSQRNITLASVSNNSVPPHANQHQWMGEGSQGGTDVLKVMSQQIVPLRVLPYSGFTVAVWPGSIRIGTTYTVIADINSDGKPIPKTIDLSTLSAALADQTEVFVLITIDALGALVPILGTAVALTTLALTDIPSVATDTLYVLAAIRLWYGQIAITENRESTDIIDLRWPMTHYHNELGTIPLPSGTPDNGQGISYDLATNAWVYGNGATDPVNTTVLIPIYGTNSTVVFLGNTYYRLSFIQPDTTTNTVKTTILDSGEDAVITSFISDELGITSIPAGDLSFSLYMTGNDPGDTFIDFEVYIIQTDGTETLFIHSEFMNEVSNTGNQRTQYENLAADLTLNATDRLKIVLHAYNNIVYDDQNYTVVFGSKFRTLSLGITEIETSADLTNYMKKSVYDIDGDGVVDEASAAPWAGITDKPATFAPSSHTHTESEITDLSHDAVAIDGISVDLTGIADTNALVYDSGTNKIIAGEAVGGGGGGGGVSGDGFWHIDGLLAIQAGVGFSYVVPRACTIAFVFIHCKETGSADSTIIDINLNGTTIFTTQGGRPSLAFDDANAVAKSGTPDVVDLVEGDVLTCDIDAIAVGAEGLSVIVAMTVNDTAIHLDVGSEISAITEKTSLVANDMFLIEDSEASNAKKMIKASTVLAGITPTIFEEVWIDRVQPVQDSIYVVWEPGGSQIVGFNWGGDTDLHRFGWIVDLDADDYIFHAMGTTGTNCGKMDFYLDSESTPFISAQDWYSDPKAYNVEKTGAVTVSTSGKHLMICWVNGKNGSSSAYYYSFSKFWFTKA